jgi:hypothetical protein
MLLRRTATDGIGIMMNVDRMARIGEE